MNDLVHTYMNNSKQKRQVASDITIDSTNRIQTILTILQLTFLKNNVGTAHPIKHRSAPITSLGLTGFFHGRHRLKDFGFATLVKTGKGKVSKGVVPTSDAYLKDAAHYAHIIAAMTVMTNAGLEVQVYLGNGEFYAYPASSIRIYTTTAQLKIDIFVPGVAVESGVNYDTQGVPYKPTLVIPFERYPKSADPCSIVQDDKVVRLEGAQMSARVFKIYSDLMGSPGVVLRKDNPLIEEMEVDPGYSMWEQLYEEMDKDPQFPQDPQSQYRFVKSWQDPTTITEVLDASRRFNDELDAINEVKEHKICCGF